MTPRVYKPLENKVCGMTISGSRCLNRVASFDQMCPDCARLLSAELERRYTAVQNAQEQSR